MQGSTTSAAANSPAIQAAEVGTSVSLLYDHPVNHEAPSLSPGISSLSTQSSGGFDGANTNVHPPNPEITAAAVRMNVPLVLNATEGAIKYFIEVFKREIGHHVHLVQCSLCIWNPNARTKWHDSRPFNLERHLFGHFGVKTYECVLCWKRFTVRDQAVKHSMRRDFTTQETVGESIGRLNI
ncbi:hypothetical protein B0J17DRAFT_645753 [Rhizoctonia solani]|nr:hypothetical protein B0J17DRAFT_645753 [Rhizoctonia solani]